MKIEYRIVIANDQALPKLGLDGWQLICISENKMYLSREIKITRAQKKSDRTFEYQKFHDLYPKKSGITSDSIIRKINEAVKNGTYPIIMEGVERYLKMIKVENIVPKFILNAETFLNQKRYEDPFEVFENRIPISEKWILDKIKDLNELEIKEVMKMKKEYEKKFNKDCTPGNLDNIIAKILGK